MKTLRDYDCDCFILTFIEMFAYEGCLIKNKTLTEGDVSFELKFSEHNQLDCID